MTDSNLTRHAQRELTLSGLLDKDSDYGGMIGVCVMRLIRSFSKEHHSGESAYLTIAIFEKLARFKTLTPITDNPKEWVQVVNFDEKSKKSLWQNSRDCSCFSYNKGVSYYSVDDKNRTFLKSKKYTGK